MDKGSIWKRYDSNWSLNEWINFYSTRKFSQIEMQLFAIYDWVNQSLINW